MKQVRCAIYTRKSSDEGLDQSFNSLDAQREACSAYILSQASEGWTQVPEHYDDGGLSGGTLERPALQRLLADIAVGRIDIVVVYKVDRLTRSLLDFAKLVEAFDRAGASFVSVTQSFNTTTSMGRLTLNMLLSFAQFEREVTAERIRDKIAASKAKGMWMGGIPLLGYKPDGRSLAIVEEHAALVRHIFERYLALGNVRLLAEEFRSQRVSVPRRSTLTGKPLGGGWFSRGQLYCILRRVIYVGDIAHRNTTYPGNHSAIIGRETFDRVQQLLAENGVGNRTRHSATKSILAGKIVDADGEPLLPVHTMKGKVRYRYYVSRALHHKMASIGMRIPAREIENVVSAHLAKIFDDPLQLMATAWLSVSAGELNLFGERCSAIAAKIRHKDPDTISSLISSVRIEADQVEIVCNAEQIAAELNVRRTEGAPSTISAQVKVHLKRSGRAMRLIQGGAPPAQVDPALIRLLLRARHWWAELREGKIDIAAIAKREGITSSYVSRVVRLAFLAPSLVEDILAGRQGNEITPAALVRSDFSYASWSGQQ